MKCRYRTKFLGFKNKIYTLHRTYDKNLKKKKITIKIFKEKKKKRRYQALPGEFFRVKKKRKKTLGFSVKKQEGFDIFLKLKKNNK